LIVGLDASAWLARLAARRKRGYLDRWQGMPGGATSADNKGRTCVDAIASSWREEAVMKGKFIASVSLFVLSTIAIVDFPSVSAAQTAPPIGGGYTNVIPIPVDDPTTKTIAGALFKPTGAGPFPAVVEIGGCNGVSSSQSTKGLIDRLLSKGVATLIVDPFTPRNEPQGICQTMANLNDKSDAQLQYVSRGGNDALAALKVLEAMPDIDANHVFLLGYSYGAIASLSATNKKNQAKVAGVIAYYPFCYENDDPSAPVLVLVGEKDDWTPAASCQASILALPMPSTYHLRSLWRCWGITWNTTKRQRKTRNNGPTLSWLRT
jgi:dienelactone hydrolase